MERKSFWMLFAGGLLVALGLAFFVSPYASDSPDGLNKVAIDEGFSDREQEHAAADGPFAGYGVKGVDNETLSTGLAGIVGVMVVLGIGLMLFSVLRGRTRAVERHAGTEQPPAMTTGPM